MVSTIGWFWKGPLRVWEAAKVSPRSFGEEGPPKISAYHFITPLLLRTRDGRGFESAVQEGNLSIVEQARLHIFLDTFGVLEFESQEVFDINYSRRGDHVTKDHDPRACLYEGQYAVQRGREPPNI